MRKKQTKTKEQKYAEEYFPVDEDDLKNTTEKIEKKVIVDSKRTVEKSFSKPLKQDIETVEKITKSKGKPKRKVSKKVVLKKPVYKQPKISLKKSGYELIITEKPQAAAKIAKALGKVVQKNNNKVAYYEVDRNGKNLVVACAVGHLFTLKQKESGQKIPVFDIEWIPNYIVRKKDFTKRYYDTILKLAKSAGSLTVATDYDIEGEVIGFNIVKFICGQKDANRMKFSTLTEKELNDAYENKSKTINWCQAIAGETRHYLDWFYGINLSRALMNSIRTTGKFRIMSIGRVQGPALNLIVKKEKEILAFKPEPYFQVFISIEDGENKLELKHTKDIFDKSDLKKFENLKGKNAQVETKKVSQSLPPQPPFDLTTLQTEAYKFYGITPSRTLQIAQSLYLAGLISYPRTSSQQLPDSIDYKTILKKVAAKFQAEKLITKSKPIQGKKTDPAHPSIYPTGVFQILSGEDEKIYNLIAKRFISLFCDNAEIENKTINAKVEELLFNAKGVEIKKKSWMEIYPSKLKENFVPDFDGEFEIKDSRIEEKETQPPRRYSPASIVSQLEKKNLGTKATRASILETLYDRGYVKDTSIKATPLGISLIETLEKHSPIIIDEKLTKNFETQMDSIQTAKKDFLEKEEKIIEKAKKAITEISNQFEKHEVEIGKELLQANVKLREEQRKENSLNVCPVCNKGNLGVTYSKKNRKYFVACDAYPDCKTTYNLPPNGMIKKTEKVCEECGFPMLMRLAKGKRPWEFCFNPKCAKNKERLEEYRKKKEEEGGGE
ncbi:MAG: DNA topoisomerase I [Nanoarchaeota archaeon]|nr:DNA topoisomerase I [Nanoarchaeota archaeon]